MIYLLCEGEQTGKTETMLLCSENRKDFGGFLSPEMAGLRTLRNLQTSEEIVFEVDLTQYEDSIQISGPYALAKSAFDTACGWLRNHMSDPNVKYLVIDEVGKLELEDKGFSNCIQEVLSQTNDKDVILIVRKNLLDQVLATFSIQDYERIDRSAMHKLFA